MTEREFPLAAFNGRAPDAPTWFRDAVAVAPESLCVEVEGARVEVLAWGERGRPGVLLGHGGMAHARWWSHVAPFLARTHRVVALSWSGMGGSDWRPRYSVDLYLAEAWAAATVAGLFEAGHPVFVGHSFGAAPIAVAAHVRGGELAGAIVVDSGVSPPDRDHFARRAMPGGRIYPTVEAALARFRLMPDQPCENPFIADWVARHALKPVEGGVTWSFDPGFFAQVEPWDSWSAVAAPACPLAFVYGDRSRIVTSGLLARQHAQAPAGTPFIAVPESHHHVMIDQPLALVAALRAILAIWEG